MHGLSDLRVLDLSEGSAGAYATKLFAEAGADVVKVGAVRDAPLARFLGAGKRVASLSTPALLDAADLIVCDESSRGPEPGPSQVLLSITPYGRSGPWQGRPATEFTLQAESGSIGTRGLPGQEPFQAGPVRQRALDEFGASPRQMGGRLADVGGQTGRGQQESEGHGDSDQAPHHPRIVAHTGSGPPMSPSAVAARRCAP
jgi:hypothetical protein